MTLWIILAILVAGYMIAVAIRKVGAAKVITTAAVEQAKLDRQQTKLDQEKELQEQKQRIEFENSPLYQKMLEASLEFMDYLEDCTLHSRSELYDELKLLENKNLTKTQQEQLKTKIKADKEYRAKLQRDHWQKWDKLEPQVDPRHNLLLSNNRVGVRWKMYNGEERRMNELRGRIQDLKKNREKIRAKV